MADPVGATQGEHHLYNFVAKAHNATIEAIGACGEALELLEDEDLVEQAARARDLLREAVDSLGFVAINVEGGPQ